MKPMYWKIMYKVLMPRAQQKEILPFLMTLILMVRILQDNTIITQLHIQQTT